MSIHIGKIIQTEVGYRHLTYKEFGALIHKNEKTVPDIYQRATMSIDLLVTISIALKKDFLKFFYDQEPMKSIRDDETTKLNIQIQKLFEENNWLRRELLLMQSLVESQKLIISFVKDQFEQNKLKTTEIFTVKNATNQSP